MWAMNVLHGYECIRRFSYFITRLDVSNIAYRDYGYVGFIFGVRAF